MPVATSTTVTNITNNVPTSSVQPNNGYLNDSYVVNTATNTNPNTVIPRNADTSVTIAQYPLEQLPYVVGFQFVEYTRAAATASPTTNIQSQIYLPMPSNLIDFNHQRYEETSIASAVVGAVQSATDLISYLGSKGLKEFGNKILGGATVASNLTTGLSTAALNGNFGALSAASGYAANPYLALFYVSPSFKKFEFSWKLSPRNANESDVIRKIIAAFQTNMSPTLTAGGLAFRYPSIINVQLLFNGQQMDYMFNFKPAIITDCIVNYTPNGVPSFFAGTRAPTEIEFKIGFTELSVWTGEDYLNDYTAKGILKPNG